MFPFDQVLPLIIANIGRVFFNPIFWLVVFLVALQYRRMAAAKEAIYGIRLKQGWGDVFTAVVYGILGGLIGSVIMVVVGLTLSGTGLIYLWPVAILLMLINPRFLCFAYAGGIIALSNLIFNFPQVNISQLLALVAILHLVESLLIFFSGHLGAVPAYFKAANGQLVGGFTLQRFWPIPIVALMVVGQTFLPEGINMPDWWPLIKPEIEGDLKNAVYTLIPVIAALGYGDLALARPPVKKSRLSAYFLGVYSLVLLLFATLAQNFKELALLAALFSPLGHELIIFMGKKIEFQASPIYISSPDGVRVLDTLKNTPAWQAGIRSYDLVLRVNGLPVFDRVSLENSLKLKEKQEPIEVEYLQGETQNYRREICQPPREGQPFGLLLVPGKEERSYLELNSSGLLGRWWQKLRRR
ncbi:signal protein PDZ [Peptococcaceae bacterium SCADC1_2_3]|nr:signal protein PDZ [Peptococcaceae bacterium SCADC1_2_3]KFI36034.1 signal protein PDZ [Peptococcaceae bacterium SCADC1_2_3]